VNHLLLPRHNSTKREAQARKTGAKKPTFFQVYKSQRIHFSKDVPKSQREAKENLRKTEQDTDIKE
jgi:hypothetical protein